MASGQFKPNPQGGENDTQRRERLLREWKDKPESFLLAKIANFPPMAAEALAAKAILKGRESACDEAARASLSDIEKALKRPWYLKPEVWLPGVLVPTLLFVVGILFQRSRQPWQQPTSLHIQTNQTQQTPALTQAAPVVPSTIQQSKAQSETNKSNKTNSQIKVEPR